MVHRRRTQRRRASRKQTRRQLGGDRNEKDFARKHEMYWRMMNRWMRAFRADDNDAKRAIVVEIIDFLMMNDNFTKSNIYMTKSTKEAIKIVLKHSVPGLPEKTVRDMESLKQFFGV